MQRPQSEGRVSSPPAAAQRHSHGHANRHRKTSVLSKSCVLLSESQRSTTGGDCDGDEDDVASASFSSFSELAQQQTTAKARHASSSSSGRYERNPRRPKTTPKPRIERLLVGPGKTHIHEAHASLSSSPAVAAPSSTLFFMTHLPDSPPRPNRTTSPSCAPSAASSSDDEEDERQVKGVLRDERANTLDQFVAASPPSTASDGEERRPSPAAELDPHTQPSIASTEAAALASPDSETDEVDAGGEEASDTYVGGDPVDSTDAAAMRAAPPAAAVAVMEADARSPASRSPGPLSVDVLVSSRVSVSPTSPQLDSSDDDDEDLDSDGESPDDRDDPLGGDEELTHSRDESSTADEPADSTTTRDGTDNAYNDDEADDEYSRSLATRHRIQQSERHREQLRGELESYVALLTTRKGEDGAQLVEFPRNYQQVLSLMSERDVRGEDASGSSGGGSGMGDDGGGQRSWSRVLIQAGLSKQQAFGALNDEEEASGGESGMAAKIALKMARVRQLDAVLEEKLGKNVYSATASIPGKLAKKSKAIVVEHTSSTSSNNNQRSPALNGSDDPLVLASLGLSAKGSSNFVERNRKVIAHGMKPVLSKDEESRLSRLLRDLGSSDHGALSESGAPAKAAAPVGSVQPPSSVAEPAMARNEFEMDATDKRQIEELLAAKRGMYHSSLLPPAEDLELDDENELKADNEALPSAKSKSAASFNVIQATKRERLRKQRLERIELEIQFLKENEHMAIVPDDDGDDGDDDGSYTECAGDGDDETDTASTLGGVSTATTSERSFRTTTSSVCSTRSGVISRRQFNQLLALEKQGFDPQTRASADEIRRLVTSLSHLNRATTTSRPVA